ncbi:MAG: type II secretion system protein [Planctomycetota bacterium]
MVSSRRAFSLVELLVVITIITLLMAIALPAMSRARESGRTAKCASNVRQIGIAATSFALDNQGDFSTGRWANNSEISDIAPDEGGWVADYVLGEYTILNQTLCPTSPARVSSFYSTESIDSGGSRWIDFEPTGDNAATSFYKRGFNTNYAASWYLAYTDMNSTKQEPRESYEFTLGPLNERTLAKVVAVSEVPLFGDAAVLAGRSTRIDGKRYKMASELSGMPHYNEFSIESRSGTSPIVGRQMYTGFGEVHGGDLTNITFADGSTRNVRHISRISKWYDEKTGIQSIGYIPTVEDRLYAGWLVNQGLNE